MDDLSRYSDDELIDMYTPEIFIPRGLEAGKDALRRNRAIEAELASRGIHRTGA